MPLLVILDARRWSRLPSYLGEDLFHLYHPGSYSVLELVVQVAGLSGGTLWAQAATHNWTGHTYDLGFDGFAQIFSQKNLLSMKLI